MSCIICYPVQEPDVGQLKQELLSAKEECQSLQYTAKEKVRRLLVL